MEINFFEEVGLGGNKSNLIEILSSLWHNDNELKRDNDSMNVYKSMWNAKKNIVRQSRGDSDTNACCSEK